MRNPFGRCAPVLGGAALIALAVLSPISPCRGEALLRFDLAKISEQLDIRYYIAEKGELPPRYILLGGLALRPNPIPPPPDQRATVIEYDRGTGFVYLYRVPEGRPFVWNEEQRDGFFRYIPRDLGIAGLGIEIASVDDEARHAAERSRRDVWLEEVKLGLTKASAETQGKGLFSVDIPLPLPKQLERIIGKGEESNLTVSGSERISIGGTSSWCSNCPYTEGRTKSDKFPDLDMEQQLSVSLHGTIGEKINVEIQHQSTGGVGLSTNRVRLNYTGFDDDVIQLIEMGDTDLSLSGAQLVSYSGTAKGLFGVKAKAQAGPLELTVIASKEEGESVSGSFSATGAQSSSITVPDYNYLDRQFFYFENPGPDFSDPIDGFLDSQFPLFPRIGPGDDIFVFQSLSEAELIEYKGTRYIIKAYTDSLNNGLQDDTDYSDDLHRKIGIFRKLTLNEDYELIRIYGQTAIENEILYFGIRTMNPVPDGQALAVTYRPMDEASNTYAPIGTYPVPPNKDFNVQTDSLIAELICPLQMYFDKGHPNWKMMMRNVYSLGTGDLGGGTVDIRIENKNFRVNADIDTASSISYLRLFGLDSYDNAGTPGADNRVDVTQGIIDTDRGYLMFPEKEPFNISNAAILEFLTPAEADSFDGAAFKRNAALYEKNLRSSTEQLQNNIYNIVVAASSGQRTFQLNALEIIKESEVVTVDGGRLTRGTDYEIDYIGGTVTLKPDIIAGMTPDSRVQIDYQQKPLVGGGRNSLLGVGATYNLSESSRLNAVFLYSSMGASKYAPRLGEEPQRTMAADINGAFQLEPKWMTTVANLLPRVDTDEQSTLMIKGEVAMSIPNPNVKGEAFVDDMEGVEEDEPLPLLRRSWYEASPVVDASGLVSHGQETMPEFYWFNILSAPKWGDLKSNARDLNPNLTDTREFTDVSSLTIKAIGTVSPEEWCGVMTGFAGGLDLTTTQYLELWVNDFDTAASDRGGILHVDFGRIDEDFFEPGRDTWDNEAQPPYYTWTSNDDIGFKAHIAFTGSDSCSLYPRDNVSGLCPHAYLRDEFNETNYDGVKGVYRNINCRTGNMYQDSEDLNSNGQLDQGNAFYSVSIDLAADTAVVDVRRDYPESKYSAYWNFINDAGNKPNKVKAWRLYRIPLSRAIGVGGETRIDAIQHMRLWIENVDSLRGTRGNILQIAEMKFVGNRWEPNGLRELDDSLTTGTYPNTKFTVGTINNKIDPAHYRPPIRVQKEEGLENKEGSLQIIFENFPDSTSFQAIRRLYGEGQSYQQYREIQFFVNHDLPFDGMEFYFRIAYDSLEYYEVALPLEPVDREQWIHATVSLSDLTNMKVGMTGDVVTRTIHDAAEPWRSYRATVRGDPTLFQVRYLFIGLRNLGGSPISSGRVWFNDIKLGSVRRDIDFAQRMSVSADFGKILNVSAGWTRTGAEFRSLRQSKGTGVTDVGLNLQAQTKLNHIVPTAGFDIPVTGRYNTASQLPKYMPQSDVEIADESIRDSLKSVRNDYSVNMSIGRSGSKNYIMRNLFDNLKLNYVYSRASNATPNTRDTSSASSGTANYTVQFNRNRKLTIWKGLAWKYWLSNFSVQSQANGKYSSSHALTRGTFVKRPNPFDGKWDTSVSTLYEPFESIKISFDANQHRNLARKQDWLGVRVGALETFAHTMNLNYQPRTGIPFLSSLNPRFEYKSRYNENIQPTLRQLRLKNRRWIQLGDSTVSVADTLWDPIGTRNVSAQRNINVVFDFDLARYLTRLGEATGLIKPGDIARQTRGGHSTAYSKKKKPFKGPAVREHPPELPGTGLRLDEEENPPSAPGGTGQTPGGAAAPSSGGERQGSGLGDLGLGRARPPAHAPGAALDSLAARADTAAVDTAAVDTAAATGAGRPPDPWLPVKQAIRIIGKLETIQTNINFSHTSSYQPIYERAGLLYQLGLVDAAGVPGASSEEERIPGSTSGNVTLGLRSGMAVTTNISFDLSLDFSQHSETSSGRTTTGTTIGWPKLSLKWLGLERAKFMQRYIQQSDMVITFERTNTKTTYVEQPKYRIAPNWNLQWKNKLSSTVSFFYSKESKIESGEDSWEKSWGSNVDLRYSIEGSKGFGLPLPILNKRKFSFKSTLTMSLNAGYSSASRFNQPAANSLSISPQATYRFSDKITGGLSMNYKRTSGGILGYINQSFGMTITAEFRF